MITGGNATVYVSSMDRAVEFYSGTLGLVLRSRYGDHWAEVQAGDTLVIGLHPASPSAPPPGAVGSISIGFMIDEPIDGAVARLTQSGVQFRGEVIRDDQGGIALAFFGDPDGNSLYLCQRLRS